MKCEKAQKLMSLWLDGMLAEKDERVLLAHLQNCEHCREVWHQWEQMRAMLRSYPLITPSPDFDRKVLSRLKTPKAPSSPIPSHWLTSPAFRLASSAVGGLVVMALTLLILMLPVQEQPKPSEQMHHWQWRVLGREVVQWFDFELRGEPKWQGGSSPSSSLLPSRSSRC
ncbi:MAG: zf-HC2 domain-containing protein [Armatimonadetes bacterium]|nr:zf-HC2 domain-containing protein [Armatimonadota bacterium]MCX7968035.1 zf-HC2 domain-containing protein [Armatimonadota bacterium]MDW8143385.1 zf-HC2 domain-containing protein [Armatimonadota bacterium]